MRTWMVLASIAVLGTGAFCMANATVAFASLAFIVAVVLLVLGAIEFLVGRSLAEDLAAGESIGILEGALALIIGLVILTGQVAEDMAVTAIFAIWLIIDGMTALSGVHVNLRRNTRRDNLTLLLGAIMLLFGIYMFFNPLLLDLSVVMMLGVALILIGADRFRSAISIEYNRPEFLTSNEEKLDRAKREEKRLRRTAMAAIRESKEVERRIAKLNREIAKEKSMAEGSERRRRARH